MIFKKLFNKFISVGLDNDIRRVKWVERILKSIPAKSRILDAGAGELRFKEFCSHLDYVSQDFGRYDGRGDEVGLQTENWSQENLDIVSDITQIPQPDNSFDAILCSEVFEHISEPIKAIKEFSRLLKKGGLLILTAPFASATHFAPFHFYSGFNIYFYKTHLKNNDFEIIEINRTGNFFKYIAQEIRRIPYIVKRYTKTKLKIWEYPVLIIFLVILSRLNNKDTNSGEFLNFDYCIIAKKK